MVDVLLFGSQHYFIKAHIIFNLHRCRTFGSFSAKSHKQITFKKHSSVIFFLWQSNTNRPWLIFTSLPPIQTNHLNDLNVRISLDYSAALMTEPTEENVTSAVDINIIYSHFSPSKFQSPLVISTIHSCSYIQRHFRLDTSLDNVGIDEARAAILLIWSSYRLNLRLWVMSVGQSNM